MIKALFTGFLSVSLSGSLVLCLILLLRLVFKKAPKAMICALWALAVVRLLIPVQIESPVSLQPEMPTFSTYDTQLFVDTEPVSADQIPDFVPHKTVDEGVGWKTVRVDYMAIAGLVWGAVAIGLLLYMVISYVRLRLRVREGILLEKGVYTVANLRTAFLMGYIKPRIYLPSDMGDKERELVIAHERAHKKRGDNWLKLISYLCLAAHWFNPLVWVAYLLICRDIEDACDELVIRNFNDDQRAEYSSALLTCGRERAPLPACPVAFGEISIKQRILNVLNYKKPTLWICIVAVIAILLTTVLFMTNPAKQMHPPRYEELTELLGESKETVLRELGITENDIAGGSDLYTGMTPIQVEYQDATFNIFLQFEKTDRDSNDKVLGSFAYFATIEDEEVGAQSALKLARHYWDCYKEGYRSDQKDDPDRLSDITLDEIREMFKNPRRYHVGTTHLSDSWDISEQGNETIEKYLEDYHSSEIWQAQYGPGGAYEREGAKLRWMLTFDAWSDADPDVEGQDGPVYIALRYNMRVTRDSGAYIADTFAQEQSWWEKLLDWLN